MEYNDFDLKMRSMLENGQEEVPAGLWSAIEERLPAAAPAKAPVIWWKWLGAGTAAAAAVVIAVLSGVRRETPGVQIESTGEMVTAAIGDDDQADGSVQMEDMAPVTVTMAVRSARTEDSRNAACTESSMENPEEPAIDDTEDHPVEVCEETPVTDESVARTHTFCETSDFDENGTEPKARRRQDERHFCFEAFSDASSNANPSLGRNATGMMKKPTAPKVTSIMETGASSYGIPFSAGVGVKIPLSGRWSMGTGVNWSMLTRSFSGQYNQVDSEGNVVSQATYSNISNTQHYLGVPVNVYFSIVSKDFIDFYAYAGGSANKCLSNRYMMNGIDKAEVYRSPDKGWQFSTGVGLGVEFIAGKHLGFYIDPSVNYWFSDGKTSNIRTHQPLMVGLELGVRIRI